MIIYLVKSTVLLGLLYGLYKLLLENEKIHYINRFFLLFALVFGLTAPLITFEVTPEQSIAGLKMQQMERVVNGPAEAVSKSVESAIVSKPAASAKTEVTPATAKESGWSVSTTDILLGIYGLITFVLFIRFMGGLLEIRQKIKAGSHLKSGSATLVLLNESITPQSFFNFIFLEKEAFEKGEIEPEILDHEQIHVRQLHSLDVLVIEFLKVIFWFNPFMYLYKHAIQLNHEFIADESVVSKASSASNYQEMLIKACAGNKPMSTTSSIGYPKVKRRLKMMFRPHSLLRSGSKLGLAIPVILLAMLTFCTNKEQAFPQKIGGSSDSMYTNVDLYLNPPKSDKLNIEKRGTGIRYDSEGNLFTGTQEFRYVKNERLIIESVFVDGVLKSNTVYHKDGSLKAKYEFGYIDENFKTTKQYNEDGLLIEEWLSPAKTDSLGSIKQWHSNGQLKFEMTFKEGMKYHGLMTSYDKQGNIITRERYEDNELVETIK